MIKNETMSSIPEPAKLSKSDKKKSAKVKIHDRQEEAWVKRDALLDENAPQGYSVVID